MVEKKSILSAHSVASKGSSNTLLPMPKWLPKTFDSLICNNGYHAFIEHALRCPCCDRGNGQALSTCRNCIPVADHFLRPAIFQHHAASESGLCEGGGRVQH